MLITLSRMPQAFMILHSSSRCIDYPPHYFAVYRYCNSVHASFNTLDKISVLGSFDIRPFFHFFKYLLCLPCLVEQSCQFFYCMMLLSVLFNSTGILSIPGTFFACVASPLHLLSHSRPSCQCHLCPLRVFQLGSSELLWLVSPQCVQYIFQGKCPCLLLSHHSCSWLLELASSWLTIGLRTVQTSLHSVPTKKAGGWFSPSTVLSKLN